MSCHNAWSGYVTDAFAFVTLPHFLKRFMDSIVFSTLGLNSSSSSQSRHSILCPGRQIFSPLGARIIFFFIRYIYVGMSKLYKIHRKICCYLRVNDMRDRNIHRRQSRIYQIPLIMLSPISLVFRQL